MTYTKVVKIQLDKSISNFIHINQPASGVLQPVVSDLRAALNQLKVGVNSVLTIADDSGVAIQHPLTLVVGTPVPVATLPPVIGRR